MKIVVKKFMTPLLPRPIFKALRSYRTVLRKAALKRKLGSVPLRLILGAGGTSIEGWVSSEAEHLNLLDPGSWETLLAPESVDAMLAEHVWEHLTLDDGLRAAKICYRYLKPGGYIRVAVPDGLHPDPEYREFIKVGGVGGGGALGGHLVVYRYFELAKLFEAAGFDTTLFEYHQENGNLVSRDWDPAQGIIRRSKRFDQRGAVSIIMDATKGNLRA